MPLPLPRLDSHRFEQLVEEGTALLQRLAPGWTDYNLHDPGITLIELLAWLVETDIYRLDRTSQAAFRAFLRLVGIQLRQPGVAKTVLVFNIADDDPFCQGCSSSNRKVMNLKPAVFVCHPQN
jgi:predicted phage baseplate assembly protein